MQQSKSKSFAKWLKNILAIAIIAFLIWYLSRHWDQLKTLVRLRIDQFVLAYITWFFYLIGSAFVTQLLLSALKVKTSYWDMVRLNNAALLLNFAPMKFGTVFRAGYLKRHYQLSFTNFATFFVYVTLLMILTSSLVGLILLIHIYGLKTHQSKVLAIVFIAGIIGSLIFLVVPLPTPKGQSRIVDLLRNYFIGHNQLSGSRKTILVSAIVLTINFLFESARIGIIYHSMGKDLHPGGYVVLGSISSVVFFLGLTPGSLGIKEAALGFSAVVLGIPLEVGILAALLERAVTLIYAFTAGGLCAIWLWFKAPGDFKKQETARDERI